MSVFGRKNKKKMITLILFAITNYFNDSEATLKIYLFHYIINLPIMHLKIQTVFRPINNILISKILPIKPPNVTIYLLSSNQHIKNQLEASVNYIGI